MRESGLRAVARSIFDQTLADCSIERAFMEKVKSPSGADQSARLLFGAHLIDSSAMKHIRVVAAGNAAKPMLDALLARLPGGTLDDVTGVLIAPGVDARQGFEVFRVGHPFPNEASFAGARAALTMLNNLPPDASAANTLCQFLVSGGASAMMQLPRDPGITFDEAIAFHRALVHSGASIMKINCVRKHFSAVKGGRFALATKVATCFTILLSDVPPGSPETIASGPTLSDASTIPECRQIPERYRLLEPLPASIRRFFTFDQMPETAKPGELTALTWTILSADDLAESTRIKAESLGFVTVIDNSCDDWNYREAAEYLLQRIRQLRRSHKRVCLISAGEIIVRPKESRNHGIAIVSGKGGHNRHFALYAVTLLEESDASISILPAGSDRIAGRSDQAGAVVEPQTLRNGACNFGQATDLRDLRILLADG